jgi:hypothetical protein
MVVKRMCKCGQSQSSLFTLVASAYKPSIGLHQLTNQKESINGSNAVADEISNEFTLGT